MLSYREQLRLSAEERRILERVTGVDPRSIKTREALDRYIADHIHPHRSDSPEVLRAKALLRRHLSL